MTELLESAAARGTGYIVAAALAIVVMFRERSRPGDRRMWPTFWLLSAILLLMMGVSQATDVGDVLTGMGREQAYESGWYGERRTYQAIVVGVVFGAWFLSVVLAILIVPPRRRRYLPSAIAQLSLMCFALIRTVSLHQIDAVLYRRHVGGVRISSAVEWVLVLINIIAIAVRLRLPREPDEDDDTTVELGTPVTTN